MQLPGPDCDDRCKVGTFPGFGGAAIHRLGRLDSAAMDRRLARRNLRTALITSVIGLLMFALTFVAALLYVA
jgi:hypothetical protein